MLDLPTAPLPTINTWGQEESSNLYLYCRIGSFVLIYRVNNLTGNPLNCLGITSLDNVWNLEKCWISLHGILYSFGCKVALETTRKQLHSETIIHQHGQSYIVRLHFSCNFCWFLQMVQKISWIKRFKRMVTFS